MKYWSKYALKRIGWTVTGEYASNALAETSLEDVDPLAAKVIKPTKAGTFIAAWRYTDETA